MPSTLQLEQFLCVCEEEGDAPPSGVVTINCGSRKFQILEQTIRSRGQSLLVSLLDDPAREDKRAPIYVEGDSERFRYVLDWYRFGSLKVPGGMSVEEMRRECAFYGLPDDVKIEREGVGDAVSFLVRAKKRARKECTSAGAVAAAHAAFDLLLHDEALTKHGQVKKSWNSLRPADWRQLLVWAAVIDSQYTGTEGIRHSEYTTFAQTLGTLAKHQGLEVKICQAPNSASIELLCKDNSKE